MHILKSVFVVIHTGDVTTYSYKGLVLGQCFTVPYFGPHMNIFQS